MAGPSRSQRLPAIWNVPYLRNPSFTGRDMLLDELHAKLTNGRVALTAVHGMGGVGKTQLALEYAYRHGGDFDLVWWLRAEEPASLLEDYAALAEPLGVGKVGEGDLAAVAEAVCQTLARLERWLLVFDNATGPGDVVGLLPRGGSGRVLITSRNPSWPRAMPLDVPVLSREAAIGFLLEQTDERDRNAADAVASELGDLPLALAQAAAYVTETGVGLAGYLDLFRTRRQALWADESPPADYSATVGTTMATDRLRASEPLAVDLLSLCAFLAPEAIPRRLLAEHHEALPEKLGAAVAEPLRLNRLVAALRRYSLVEVTGEALSVHRLVQAAARDALSPAKQRRWVEAAVALMRAAFPYDRNDPATWAPSSALLAHVLAAASDAEENAPKIEGARHLLNAAAGYFERRRDLHQTKSILERAKELAEETLGPEHPELAIYTNNLGYVLHDLGDLAGARAAYERALQMDEKSFGPNHPRVATGVNNLALVLKELGDLAGATAALERALHIDEAVYGPDHPEVATDVNNLGMMLKDLGDLAGARAALERALRIFEKHLGPEHPNVATLVSNLGLLFADLGDMTGARSACQRALAICKKVYGPDHPQVALYLNSLGSVLQDLGDLAGAQAAYERAIEIDERSFGPDHPDVAIRVNNLGGVLKEMGDLAGAKAAYDRALRIFEGALGPEHPKTRIARGNLEGLGGG